MARVIDQETYLRIKKNNCDKSKHRFRTNKYGVTWCVICGLLSTSGVGQDLVEDDKLIITQNDKEV